MHDGKPDVVALQVVTVSQRSREVAREWFAANRDQDDLQLQLHRLSLEAGDGRAERMHRPICGELANVSDDMREMSVLFKQGYREFAERRRMRWIRTWSDMPSTLELEPRAIRTSGPWAVV